MNSELSKYYLQKMLSTKEKVFDGYPNKFE